MSALNSKIYNPVSIPSIAIGLGSRCETATRGCGVINVRHTFGLRCLLHDRCKPNDPLMISNANLNSFESFLLTFRAADYGKKKEENNTM